MISRAAVVRKHNIAPGQLAAWQKQYEQGKLSDTPGDPALHQRVAELERLVGRMTLENDLLKKAADSAKPRNGRRVITKSVPRRSSAVPADPGPMGVPGDGTGSQQLLLPARG